MEGEKKSSFVAARRAPSSITGPGDTVARPPLTSRTRVADRLRGPPFFAPNRALVCPCRENLPDFGRDNFSALPENRPIVVFSKDPSTALLLLFFGFTSTLESACVSRTNDWRRICVHPTAISSSDVSPGTFSGADKSDRKKCYNHGDRGQTNVDETRRRKEDEIRRRVTRFDSRKDGKAM